MAGEFKIILYETTPGTSPVADFIKNCPDKMRAKIEMEIALLRESGNNISMPYSEHLEDGIFELRAKVASNITRVLYFFCCRKAHCSYKWLYKKDAKNSKE